MSDGDLRGSRETHWDAAYATRGEKGVSWYQASPRASLRLIEALALPLDAAIIDVGGGASTLTDSLVEEGRTDLTVLDISEAALRATRARTGDPATVEWLHEDLFQWQPRRFYDLWHDRAVFHFLVQPAECEAYLAKLRSALSPWGAVVIGAFAPDGPQQCSGLPVARYSSEDLASLLGRSFEVVETSREDHRTPRRSVQRFAWVAARRTA